MTRSSRSSGFRPLTTAALSVVLVALTGALSSGCAGNQLDGPATESSTTQSSQSEAGTTQSGTTEASGKGSAEAGSIEAVAEELARGQERDRAELNAKLATAAEVAHEHLAHVLQGLTAAVADGRDNGAGDADDWRNELKLAIASLEAVGEGTSEQTVAREAFIGAAHLLEAATSEYEHLSAGPAGDRAASAETVIARRDAAVRLWQSGAGQLDTLTVGSGGGHVHLFLAPDGDPDAVPQEFREPEEPTH